MKNLLILGGTNFIGRVLVEELLKENRFDITLFNRGRKNGDLFPQLKRITGDRETDDYRQISNHSWDCIVDLSGYYPHSFEKLVTSLDGKVKRYIFISSISVYDIVSFNGREISEEDPILSCSAAQKTSKLPDSYGEKKAEMERILMQQKWLDKIIIRPSFVYGRYDFTDRFYYWFWRGKNQKRVLLPSAKDYNLSLTEVNQLAHGIISAIDIGKHNTVYNAITFSKCRLRDIVAQGEQLSGEHVHVIRAHKHILDKCGLNENHFPLYSPFPFLVNDLKWKMDFGLNVPGKLVTPDLVSYYEKLNWYEPKTGLSPNKESDLISNL